MVYICSWFLGLMLAISSGLQLCVCVAIAIDVLMLIPLVAAGRADDRVPLLLRGVRLRRVDSVCRWSLVLQGVPN